MKIKEYTGYNEDEILNLYRSVGWTAYTDDPKSLKEGFNNSLFTLAAYEDGILAGIIRVVGDGKTIVYIQDILVLPHYRRKGIGSALIQSVLKKFENVRQIMLATDDVPENVAFYRSQGFTPLSEAGCQCFMKIK